MLIILILSIVVTAVILEQAIFGRFLNHSSFSVNRQRIANSRRPIRY